MNKLNYYSPASEIDAAIEALRQVLPHKLTELSSQGSSSSSPAIVSKAVVLSRIEICIQDTVVALSQGEVPFIQWHNFSYDSVKCQKRICFSYAVIYKNGKVETKQTFVQLVHLLEKIHCLLRSDAVSTTRDLYYEDVSFWKKQDTLDALIRTVSELLGVPRYCLNITATAKGLIAGNLSFRDEFGRIINCDSTVTLIPQDVEALMHFRSTAKFILLIEKDATFQKLLDDKVFAVLGHCILITGKGYPDQATRRFLKKLWEELKLPVLALVDGDPHGISIMSTYRYGSEALKAEKERLAVPEIRWLGIHPSDVEQLQLPQEAILPLTDKDRNMLNNLKIKPEIQESPQLLIEIDTMLRLSCKVEIQGLTKMDTNRRKSTRNVKKTSTVSSNRNPLKNLNGLEVGPLSSRPSKVGKTMAEVELIVLDDDEDEVKVVEHAKPLETLERAAKRASLPRKCKFLTCLPSQPQAMAASRKKAESLKEIEVAECLKHARVTIPRLEDVDLPPNKPILEPIPQETHEEEPEPQGEEPEPQGEEPEPQNEEPEPQNEEPEPQNEEPEPRNEEPEPQNEEPEPQEEEPEPPPKTRRIRVRRKKRAASVLDLNFIPLSENVEVLDVSMTSEEDFMPLTGLSADENRNSTSVHERNEQEFEGTSSILRKLRKRKRLSRKEKRKRLSQQPRSIDLTAIPLPDDPRNTPVSKPSLRQLVKARRRCQPVKKRESLLAANRGIPLIEEIVIEDDDEEVVVQQPLLRSPQSQENRHENSVFVFSGANQPSPAEVTLDEGEIRERTDDDEIQFVGAKAAPPSPKRLHPVAGPANASKGKINSSPNRKVVKPMKDRKKCTRAKRSPEKSRAQADRRRENRRREAEMSTQTTPSLGRVPSLNSKMSQNCSSPLVKSANPATAPNTSQGPNENIRPTTNNSTSSNYNRVWDHPPSGPNMPFVPTVHQVPRQFDFRQDGYNPAVHGHLRNVPIPLLYNPEAASLPRVGLRPIIIDGCNVAMHHGRDTIFSVQGIQLCVDYFLKLGHRVIAFVPENCFGREPTDPKLLDKLERMGYVVRTPGRVIRGKNVTSYDDKYIVSYATEVGGVIVSRDKYRDLIGERWSWRATIEGRLLQPTFVDNMVMFPDDPLGRWGPRLPAFLSF